MKDGIEYAEMLGMTVSSCDVVVKPARRKKKRNVKEEVMAKVNEIEEVKEIEVKEQTEDLEEYQEVGEIREKKRRTP